MTRILTLTLATLFLGSTASAQFSIRVARSSWGKVVVAAPADPKAIHEQTIRQQDRAVQIVERNAIEHQRAMAQLASWSPLAGEWRVSAKDINATLNLAADGFRMITPNGREHGSWQTQSTHSGFILSIRSSTRGDSTFRATWLIPGRQFRMVSDASGRAYTVTKTTDRAPSIGVF